MNFKLLRQTKSLPQILTCHQHHESCFKQRRAVHAEDRTHFLSYTALILWTGKYIQNSLWRASDEPLDLPPWLPPSLSAAPIIGADIWSICSVELLTWDKTDSRAPASEFTAWLKGPALRVLNHLRSQTQESTPKHTFIAYNNLIL